MNKKEILADIESKSFVNRVLATNLIEDNNGIKWYQTNTLQVYANTAIRANIDFYVVDEGKATEAAYYKDAVPETKVQEEIKDIATKAI
ncbi:MAG TPA: hypothetical protein PLF57_01465 [Candidatus Saccharibacteria bacterium]|nr:hypothetical protein [Candidatus Saccharibacteria bacterium]